MNSIIITFRAGSRHNAWLGSGHRCLASAATPADGVQRLMKGGAKEDGTRRDQVQPAGLGGERIEQADVERSWGLKAKERRK